MENLWTLVVEEDNHMFHAQAVIPYVCICHAHTLVCSEDPVHGIHLLWVHVLLC